MSLGLESKIQQMDPKLKKLFGNIISVLFIIVILYAVLILVFPVSWGGYGLNVFGFIQSPDLVTVIMLGFFLYLAWAFLSGRKIKVPEQPKGKKTKFNIPNPYGVQSARQKQQPKLHNNPIIRGSWKCPKCEFLVVATSRCPKCGFQRRR